MCYLNLALRCYLRHRFKDVKLTSKDVCSIANIYECESYIHTHIYLLMCTYTHKSTYMYISRINKCTYTCIRKSIL